MNFLNFISKIIFPPQCLVCGKDVENDAVCEECFHAIPLFETLRCSTCDARLPDNKKICHVDAPYRLAAATSYGVPAMRTLVHKLKFRRIRKAAEPLGDLIACYLARLDFDLEKFMIVPVPLSRKRCYERGFNQAEEIANRVADNIGRQLIVRNDILMRIKNTRPQTETATKKDRLENIRCCFAVRDPALVQGGHILLLDDVSTSGATLLEAARTLKSAGAKIIIGLVAAKA